MQNIVVSLKLNGATPWYNIPPFPSPVAHILFYPLTLWNAYFLLPLHNSFLFPKPISLLTSFSK